MSQDAAFGEIAIILVVVVFYFWRFRRSQSVLKKWAAHNDLQIVQADLKWLFKGPFFGRTFRGQTVFQIRAF